MKPIIKEVIVVEGKSDTNVIKRFLECDTIETNGSAVEDHVIKRIKLANDRRGVIIFTDPDYPGEKIRHIINEKVPGCKHAFISKESAIDYQKKKVGVEHANKESILSAIEKAKPSSSYEVVSEITKEDLLHAKLIGGSGSRERREALGTKLNIGYTNGKQLLKRLQQFQISKNEFADALRHIERGEDDDR
ncbi:ribonuclease M5 [Evansella cellulosilytica]|uniref:Ribonuclease M5 n=1 Tax=Evansella cellulosilytica (strain ATCC 21833 / DSM 2522 / FERM P-1141 / JCM 9156 / N-4) TaxID=649639 RepID=E6TRN9_EVAC2|nr:ribonuclease M5 [Evansella cellulosilytica]ADU28333.1 primase/topoisomerase like protein [Evansella cellulosilytica DSM 2522]